MTDKDMHTNCWASGGLSVSTTHSCHPHLPCSTSYDRHPTLILLAFPRAVHAILFSARIEETMCIKNEWNEVNGPFAVHFDSIVCLGVPERPGYFT